MNIEDAARGWALIAEGAGYLSRAYSANQPSALPGEAPARSSAEVPSTSVGHSVSELPPSFEDLPPENERELAALAASTSPQAAPAPVGQGSLTICPKHKLPYRSGVRNTKYCPGQSDESNWSNEKGYCTITPRSAAKWLSTHSGVAA